MKPEVENYWMATSGTDEHRAEYGPFKTSMEAEKAAKMLEWGWIMRYRFKQDGSHAHRFWHVPGYVTPEATAAALNDEEQKFFKLYEEQMK